MEPEGRAAFCPTCKTEYKRYVDADARTEQQPGAEPETRICFGCSLRRSRWDALWLPFFFLLVLAFPLFWMLWSHVIAPLLLVAVVVWPLWRRAERLFRYFQQRSLTAQTGDLQGSSTSKPQETRALSLAVDDSLRNEET